MSTDALRPAALPPHHATAGTWLRDTWHTLYDAGLAWNRDNAMRLAAAIAMYTILSLSPLLVITIKVLSLILDQTAATHHVQRQVETFLGPAIAKAVEGMIVDTTKPGAGVLATAISVGVLLFTASGVFGELRDSLNALWHVKPKAGGGIWRALVDRFVSFGMVFVVGFLLLVSLVISTALTALSEYVVGGPGWVAVVSDFVVSTLVVTLLFGLIFRFLPDVRLGLRDVLFGSVVTAVLFKVGQYVLALYFTYGTTVSAYGAAGSFVAVLLWVYYSCWILFYGAELIAVNAARQGRTIAPSEDAKPTAAHPDPAERVAAGTPA
jgi:membrane protein